MAIRNLGLGGGLALGGTLILCGILMMSSASPAAAGGLMIVLGTLFLVVPGVFIAGSTLLVWVTTSLYGSLGSTAKQRVLWSILFLAVIWISSSLVGAYINFQSSPLAERERFNPEQATLDASVRNEQIGDHQILLEGFLAGTWRSETNPNYVVVFNDSNETYSMDDGEVNLRGSWNVHLEDGEPPVIQLIRNTGNGSIVEALVQVNDTQLVTESRSGPGNATYEPGTGMQRYSRVIDTAALPKSDARTGSRDTQRMQTSNRHAFGSIRSAPIATESSFAETRIIDGVAHQFYEKPIAVATGGGTVRSGPGLEHARVTSMNKGDPVALLSVTDADLDGFLWFQIRYRDGLEGYASGMLLCAREEWIKGLHHPCPAFFHP